MDPMAVRRWVRRHPLLQDTVLACAVAGAGIAGELNGMPRRRQRVPRQERRPRRADPRHPRRRRRRRLLSPKATRGLVQHVLDRPDPLPQPAALDQLTDREREVVILVAHGLSNEDIAESLQLTAKTHVNRAMTKLAARDRSQLVVIAYQNGLVRPGDTPP